MLLLKLIASSGSSMVPSGSSMVPSGTSSRKNSFDVTAYAEAASKSGSTSETSDVISTISTKLLNLTTVSLGKLVSYIENQGFERCEQHFYYDQLCVKFNSDPDPKTSIIDDKTQQEIKYIWLLLDAAQSRELSRDFENEISKAIEKFLGIRETLLSKNNLLLQTILQTIWAIFLEKELSYKFYSDEDQQKLVASKHTLQDAANFHNTLKQAVSPKKLSISNFRDLLNQYQLKRNVMGFIIASLDKHGEVCELGKEASKCINPKDKREFVQELFKLSVPTSISSY